MTNSPSSQDLFFLERILSWFLRHHGTPLETFIILIHSVRHWSNLMCKHFLGKYDLGNRSGGWGSHTGKEGESIKDAFSGWPLLEWTGFSMPRWGPRSHTKCVLGMSVQGKHLPIGTHPPLVRSLPSGALTLPYFQVAHAYVERGVPLFPTKSTSFSEEKLWEGSERQEAGSEANANRCTSGKSIWSCGSGWN